jgi:hypothetical protein
MNFSVGIALQWGEKIVSCMRSKNMFSLIPLGVSQKPMSFSIDIGEIVAETMSFSAATAHSAVNLSHCLRNLVQVCQRQQSHVLLSPLTDVGKVFVSLEVTKGSKKRNSDKSFGHSIILFF